MKKTARKTRSTEDTRLQLRTVLAEAATRTQLQLQLELGDAMRRDLREFVITAGTAALVRSSRRNARWPSGRGTHTYRRAVLDERARHKVSW